MDLTKFMPNWKGKSAEETEERPLTALERLAARRNHGPVKTRSFTNGQIRRMMQREAQTAHKHQVLRTRRAWMDKRMGLAVLRGQLQVVTALPLNDGTYADIDHPSVPAITRALVEQYGSVSAAAEVYGATLADQEA